MSHDGDGQSKVARDANVDVGGELEGEGFGAVTTSEGRRGKQEDRS